MCQLLLFYLLNANHLSPKDKALKHQLMSELGLFKDVAKGKLNV